MKQKATLSVVLGLFFGAACFFFIDGIGMPTPFFLAVLSGILFSFLMVFCLVILEIIDNRKYAKFEAEITSPIFYKGNGNFNLGDGTVRNGRVYFCESGIVCVSLDAKPFSLDEIPLPLMDHIAYDQIHLNLYLKDGRGFYITLPDADKIFALLRQRDWVE